MEAGLAKSREGGRLEGSAAAVRGRPGFGSIRNRGAGELNAGGSGYGWGMKW
ncbi:MAG: hypothetical protein GWO24_29010 [Akkermansiaceae bacterium]|nr:hypothetical protein [Akkermansiaceae bacterium]